MPLDPVLVLDTKAWFRKAATDFRSADVDIAAAPPILEDAVFHCQQAVEKGIKGFLTFHQRPFGKSHDLRELGKACASLEPGLSPLLERAAPLTWYAWKSDIPARRKNPPKTKRAKRWRLRGRWLRLFCPCCPKKSARESVGLVPVSPVADDRFSSSASAGALASGTIKDNRIRYALTNPGVCSTMTFEPSPPEGARVCAKEVPALLTATEHAPGAPFATGRAGHGCGLKPPSCRFARRAAPSCGRAQWPDGGERRGGHYGKGSLEHYRHAHPGQL